jgi:hypothetical protein
MNDKHEARVKIKPEEQSGWEAKLIRREAAKK